MEDFSQLSNALLNEYRARSIPFSPRDYVRLCLESLADLISEERPEQFHSTMARFFAALYGGNDLFNRLPIPSRNNLDSVTIGVPPRRLFELLNDFGRVIDHLSLLEMSSKTIRSALHKNGFAHRPNEFFSLLEQVERLDWVLIESPNAETTTTESGSRGAPQFKKNPPFGPKVMIDTKNAINTFLAEWHPGLNKEKWCDEYRNKMKRPDWNVRKILYDHLTFSDS